LSIFVYIGLFNNDKLATANALVCIDGYLDYTFPTKKFDDALGNYVGNTTNKWTGMPTGTDGWGTLVVFKSNDKVIQFWYAWNAGILYYRLGKNNTWYNWAQV
jgi:hypothetical protein